MRTQLITKENPHKRSVAIHKGINKYEESLKRPKKCNITLSIDEELWKEARRQRINASALTENVLRIYISKLRNR